MDDKTKKEVAIRSSAENEKNYINQNRLYESDFDCFLMLEQEVSHNNEV